MVDTYTIPIEPDFEKTICKDVKKSDDDTVISFLLDCMKEKNIGNNQLSKMTGIEKGEISRYLNGERKISNDHLCLICIALRLSPDQQRYLFNIAKEVMPREKGKFNERESIIRFYMDACYFLFECTVANCNNRLSKNKEPLLSLLLPEKEKQSK